MSSHSHPTENSEIRQYTRVDVDPDIEHSHFHHNHMNHNLHQHLSREATTPPMCSSGKACLPSLSLPSTPGQHTHDLHLTCNPSQINASKDKLSLDKFEQTCVTPKVLFTQYSNQLAEINPIVRQLKSRE
jgi:hypothetical protein